MGWLVNKVTIQKSESNRPSSLTLQSNNTNKMRFRCGMGIKKAGMGSPLFLSDLTSPAGFVLDPRDPISSGEAAGAEKPECEGGQRKRLQGLKRQQGQQCQENDSCCPCCPCSPLNSSARA